MVVRRAGALLAVALCLLFPGQAEGQWLVDIAGTWGQEERAMGAGLGYRVWHVAAVVGASAVEHGLKHPYVWTDDKTGIRDPVTGAPIDPRVARTVPYVGVWARLEVKPSWYGGTVMWDPRKHWALGAFGSVGLSQGAEAMGELRWVHTLGYVLAFRLRFL